MAQMFLPKVSEQEMPWKCITQFDLAHTSNNLSVSLYQHIITETQGNLIIYSNETEQGNLFFQISSLQEPKPLYHPLYITELIRLNQTQLLEKILIELLNSVEKNEVKASLGIKLDTLLDPQFRNTSRVKPPPAPAPVANDMDWFFSSPAVSAPAPVQQEPEGIISSADLNRLKEKLQDLDINLPGLTGDLMLRRQLLSLIDIYQFFSSQTRAMDDFGIIFYLHVRLFRFYIEARIPISLRPTCLSTMEIAWALHSDQQDTFFQTLFTSDMEWSEMRQYGMGLWVTSTTRLRNMIEAVVRNDYRKNRDPQTVTLWYLALNKRNILLGLYKVNPELKKIYDFMARDFSDEKNRVAALKNGFELRKQRRYEMSAAFFLLANSLKDAVEILCADLGDVQMGLVVARLVEEHGLVYYEAVEKYLLGTGFEARDPWLVSIGYTLLGRHGQSLDCLVDLSVEMANAVSPHYWNDKSQPKLSEFHPSIIHFSKLLKNSWNVKRDLESKGYPLAKYENLDNLLADRCIRNYLRSGLHMLSFFLQAMTGFHMETHKSEALVTTQLTMLISDYADSEWSSGFPTINSEINCILKRYGVPLKNLYDFMSDLFYKRDLRHYQCGFLISVGMVEKGAEAVLHRASVIHIILSRLSRDPYYICNLNTAKHISDELIICRQLLYSKKGSQMNILSLRLRTSIFQITLSIYLASIIYHYMKGNWLHAANDLGRLSIYLSDQAAEIPLEISDETDARESKKDLISVWMKYLIVSKLDSILSNLDYKEYDQWMEESLLEFNYLDPDIVFIRSKTELPKKQIDRRLGPGRGIKKRPLMPMARLVRRVQSWRRRLLLIVETLVSYESMETVQKLVDKMVSLDIRDPTINENLALPDDFMLYRDSLDQDKHVHLLLKFSAQGIGVIVYENYGKVSEALQKESFIYQDQLKEMAGLFKGGIELYRTKETIRGFAVNRCDRQFMSIIVESAKKDTIREINILHSLKYKPRNDALELLEDDPDRWTECLSQYSNIIEYKSDTYSPTINSAIFSINSVNSIQTDKSTFPNNLKLPPDTWSRVPIPNLLSNLGGEKTRIEPAISIEGHPQLPVYVTGGHNGNIVIWEYTRASNLDELRTGTLNSVYKLEFNCFGDKLGASDKAGNFYLYKFDLQPSSSIPQLSLLSTVSGSKTSDFAFLNLGSVVATIGDKPKPFLSIYDTLLPPSHAVVQSDIIGGSIMRYISRYQQLIISSKKGNLDIYDIRQRKICQTIDTKHEEIRDIVADKAELTISTGGKGGFVKIWDSARFTLRESIDVIGKRGRGWITQLEFVENSLFAATSEGVVKFLRLLPS